MTPEQQKRSEAIRIRLAAGTYTGSDYNDDVSYLLSLLSTRAPLPAKMEWVDSYRSGKLVYGDLALAEYGVSKNGTEEYKSAFYYIRSILSGGKKVFQSLGEVPELAKLAEAKQWAENQVKAELSILTVDGSDLAAKIKTIMKEEEDKYYSWIHSAKKKTADLEYIGSLCMAIGIASKRIQKEAFGIQS